MVTALPGVPRAGSSFACGELLGFGVLGPGVGPVPGGTGVVPGPGLGTLPGGVLLPGLGVFGVPGLFGVLGLLGLLGLLGVPMFPGLLGVLGLLGLLGDGVLLLLLWFWPRLLSQLLPLSSLAKAMPPAMRPTAPRTPSGASAGCSAPRVWLAAISSASTCSGAAATG